MAEQVHQLLGGAERVVQEAARGQGRRVEAVRRRGQPVRREETKPGPVLRAVACAVVFAVLCAGGGAVVCAVVCTVRVADAS